MRNYKLLLESEADVKVDSKLKSGFNKVIDDENLKKCGSKLANNVKEYTSVYNEKIDSFKQQLEDSGITKEQIDECVEIQKKNVINLFTDGDFTIKKFIDKFKVSFNDIFDTVGKSIFSVLIVVTLNNTLSAILRQAFGLSSMNIIAMIVGPLVEETGKALSIKFDYMKSFFVVFNIVEFFLYIRKIDYLPAIIGNELKPYYIIIRLLCVIFHGVLTLMHANNDKVPTRIKWIVAFFCHMVWNSGFVMKICPHVSNVLSSFGLSKIASDSVSYIIVEIISLFTSWMTYKAVSKVYDKASSQEVK